MTKPIHFPGACAEITDTLADTRDAIKQLKSAIASQPAEGELEACPLKPESNASEMMANLTLAQRHLEDATARLALADRAYLGHV